MKKGKIIIILIIIVATIALGAIVFEIFLLKSNQATNTNTANGNIDGQNNQNMQVPANQENIQNNIVPPIIDNNIPNEITNEIPNQTSDNQPTTKMISRSYYYNQLNSNAKIIYDKLKENKDKLMTGNYVLDFDTQFNILLHAEKGEQQLNEAFQSAWNAFYYDEPDLFYIDSSKLVLLKKYTDLGGIVTHYISIGPSENGNYLKEEFQTKEKIEEAKAYIKYFVDQIVEQTKNDTDLQKTKRIHDWIVSFLEYDTNKESKNAYHIYALSDRKAVCEGYARIFKYLMEEVGVPCILVSGNATNEQGQTQSHAWNYVQLNYVWYAVDVTWDDPVIVGEGTLNESAKYKYFLKGSDTFFKDHKEEPAISENSMKFQFPTLTKVDYTLN